MQQRSNVQGVHRYFATVWSLFALVIAVVSVGIATAWESTPTWVTIVFAALSSALAGVVGFIYGITLFTAMKHDADEQRKVV